MHSSIIILACLISFKSLFVLSLRLFLEPSLVIVERSHFFKLRAAEKDLFLLRWLQDLSAETCRSRQFHLSCSADWDIPETSSCCLQCHRVQFLLTNPVAPRRFKNLLIKKDSIVCAYTTSPGWLKRKSLRLSAVLQRQSFLCVPYEHRIETDQS